MIEYKLDEAGEFRYRIKGENGEPMATSEGYTLSGDSVRGFQDLKAVILKEYSDAELVKEIARRRHGD